jgi:hypothetical protein
MIYTQLSLALLEKYHSMQEIPNTRGASSTRTDIRHGICLFKLNQIIHHHHHYSSTISVLPPTIDILTDSSKPKLALHSPHDQPPLLLVHKLIHIICPPRTILRQVVHVIVHSS